MKMKIKLICTDCKQEFSCEKGGHTAGSAFMPTHSHSHHNRGQRRRPIEKVGKYHGDRLRDIGEKEIIKW